MNTESSKRHTTINYRVDIESKPLKHGLNAQNSSRKLTKESLRNSAVQTIHISTNGYTGITQGAD